ncbi:MAG: tetratricopeptide repeat protein [Cytophagaceae bacterium]|nr:tetratricopeptide repeat protein [Cytophagaceae bacterium]
MLYRWLPILVVAFWPVAVAIHSLGEGPADKLLLDRRVEDTLKRANNQAVIHAKKGNLQAARSILVRLGTTNDTVRYNLALVELQLNNFEDAAKLLRSSPGFALAPFNLGVAECQAGDYENGLLDLSVAPHTKATTDKLAFNKGLANLRLNALDGRNNVGQAEQYFRQAIAANPNELRYRMARGDALMIQKRYGEALKYYRQALDETSHPVLYAQLGQAALAEKKWAEAAGYFEEYFKTNDRNRHLDALLGLGHAYYRQKLFEKATLQYQKAIKLAPNSFRAHTGLGNALCSLHDYLQAAHSYDQALSLDSTSRLAHLGRGITCYRMGEFKQAVRHFRLSGEALNPKNREHYDFYVTQGFSILRSGGRGQDSYPLFEVARKLNARSPVAWAGLSESHIQVRSYPAALNYAEQAIRLDYDNDRLLTNRANLLLKFDYFDKAHENFRHATNSNPHNLNALNGLAITLLELDRMDEALRLYDSLINRTPKAFLYNNRGIVKSYIGLRSERAKDFRGAQDFYQRSLKDFEQAQELDSARGFYNNNAGNVYKNIRNYDQAFRSYEAYLSKIAINNMGVMFANASKRDASHHYLNTAINLDSTNFIYLYNRSRLYTEFFKDSLSSSKDMQEATKYLKMMPPSSIASRYSRDGYITIYMHDYEFEKFDFKSEHLFPVEPETAEKNTFMPVLDFVAMPLDAKTKVKPPAYTKLKVKNFRDPNRRVKRWGGTRCPTS